MMSKICFGYYFLKSFGKQCSHPSTA